MSEIKTKTTATSITIDSTVYLKLRRIAENENRSLSNLINHVCESYIFDVQKNAPEMLTPKNHKI